MDGLGLFEALELGTRLMPFWDFNIPAAPATPTPVWITYSYRLIDSSSKYQLHV